jgi:hypothetical protein
VGALKAAYEAAFGAPPAAAQALYFKGAQLSDNAAPLEDVVGSSGPGLPLVHLAWSDVKLEWRYGSDGAPAAAGCLRAHCPACKVAGACMMPRPLCGYCSDPVCEAVVLAAGQLPPGPESFAAPPGVYARGTGERPVAVTVPAAAGAGPAQAAAADGGIEGQPKAYTWRDLASLHVRCLKCGRSGPVSA